jgi:hypothetical protein
VPVLRGGGMAAQPGACRPHDAGAPRFLPDGRPFKPDLERAKAVHQAHATITELEDHRAVRRPAEPELEAG